MKILARYEVTENPTLLVVYEADDKQVIIDANEQTLGSKVITDRMLKTAKHYFSLAGITEFSTSYKQL